MDQQNHDECTDQCTHSHEVLPFKPKAIAELQKKRDFWDSQPVLKINEIGTQQGPIEEKKVQDVRATPYPLIDKFSWCEVNLESNDELEQVYQLLRDNYVEDDDNMFRFDYSTEFLKWALMPPGYYQDWIVGVRASQTNKLVGFITGIPVVLVMEDEKFKTKMTEINFLCVHKKLRSNRLAPVLIKEITRRVNIRNMWQAVYTAGIVIPTPVVQTRYHHRSLNPKKLIEVGFSGLGPNQTIARQVKLYRLPDEPKNQSLRPMKKKDVAQVTKLLNNYLQKFELYFHFKEEEVKHFLLPRKDVIYSYVIENQVETDGKKEQVVTDFLSFYCLPSSILKNPKYNQLRAAYSYYNVATKMSLSELMSDALILAKKEGFDVFNALDIMDNESFLKDLLFCPGDGTLNYYLYNWRLSKMLTPSQIGIVLV